MLRLSGDESLAVAQAISPGGPVWKPRRASHRSLVNDGRIVDLALVTWFPGPNSFTGEDVVEIGCHGNPVLVEQIVDLCVKQGCRLARPGEFTRRAFENGRLNLVQAEATRALIEARSTTGTAVALAGLEGRLAKVLSKYRDQMLDLASELEAKVDHPGEDLSFKSDQELAESLQGVAAEIRTLANSWTDSRSKIQGASVALFGPTNAGKSSLFNALVEKERALVSSKPGTTRDVVERGVVWDGLEVTFFDTAGVRHDAGDLEREGFALGTRLLAEVDLRLVVLALHDDPAEHLRGLLASEGFRWENIPTIVVGTHTDRLVEGMADQNPLLGLLPENTVVHGVSNKTKDGISDLRQIIRDQLGNQTPTGVELMLCSQRQHDLCKAIESHLLHAGESLLGILGPVVAAEEVTRALDKLGELRGDDVREDVLDRMFARFCIGK